MTDPAPAADPTVDPSGVTPTADPTPTPAATPPAADPKPAEPAAPASKADPAPSDPKPPTKAELKAAEKAAVDGALAAQARELAKVLGLPGFESKEVDPAKLVESLTAERDKHAAELSEYKLADSVRDAVKAKGVDGDAEALLDSTRFRSKVKALDSDAKDYDAQLTALVASEVAANPKYKSGPTIPGRSGADTSTGTGETDKQLTREQFKALSPKERLKAVEDGLAAKLLGSAK